MIHANRVEEMVKGSLAETEDNPNRVDVEATIHTFALDKEKLAEHRDEVVGMLLQLDDSFMDDGGQGMSLMNMVATRDGELWGEQMHADQLYVLAAGLGLAKFTLPREAWGIMPGGMPYITVARSKFGESASADAE